MWGSGSWKIFLVYPENLLELCKLLLVQALHQICLLLIFRLFHILVDSDKTAAQILSIMNKHKLPGEVTFMPLNRLLSKEQQYPTTPVSNPLKFLSPLLSSPLLSSPLLSSPLLSSPLLSSPLLSSPLMLNL